MTLANSKYNCLAVATLLIWLRITSQCFSLDLYVAPDGLDTNPGTKSAPLATIRGAQDAVRSLKYAGHYPPDGVTVNVSGGLYRLEEPLWFTPIDSGIQDAPVLYSAADGESVVLSGGKEISGWTKHSNGVWKAPAKGQFRQLYVNDKRAIRARSPNGVDHFSRLVKWNHEDQTVVVPANTVPEVSDPGDMEFHVHVVWEHAILRIASTSVVDEQAILYFKNPERTWRFNQPYPTIGSDQAFHLENHMAFLDAPGEWYHDCTTGILYYIPREGEDMTKAVVIAPHLERLLRIEGTVNRPVENLTFRGFTFAHTNWLRPTRTGLQGLQAGMYTLFASMDNTQVVGRPKAAVEVVAAQNIRFERNVFQNLGATALDLCHATAECEVVGNVFRNIAGGPIRHGMFSPADQDHHFVFLPDDLREVCSNDHIHNNLITRSALDYPGNCAIACGTVRGVRIEHNTITDMPYSAISVGWGWDPTPNAMADNRIRYNRISRVIQVLTDGAAIYTLSPQRDSEIAFNYVTDISPSKWRATQHPGFGIYLDEASDYIHRHSNVLKNVGHCFHTNRNGDHNQLGPDFTFDSDDMLSEEALQIVNQSGLEANFRDLMEAD